MDGVTCNKYNISKLADELISIYCITKIKKEHKDTSVLLKNITGLVDDSIRVQTPVAVAKFPSNSRLFSAKETIAKSFLNKYHDTLGKAEKIAYLINNTFGNMIDLTAVLCPFILLKMGVPDEQLSFYLSLGLILAKIVCNSLAEKEHKKQEKLKRTQLEKIKNTCNELQNYVNKSYEADSRKEMAEISKNIMLINESLQLLNDDLSKISNSLDRTTESLKSIENHQDDS